MANIYKREAFLEALKRFNLDAKALTDSDLEQLGIVDPDLKVRAIARRAGVVEQDTEEDRKYNATPVTHGFLSMKSRDMDDPILATYRHRIDLLERRIKQLEDRPSLSYEGTWDSSKVYQPGQSCTWGGSMWIARSENLGIKPGEASHPSRCWQLAVKAGRPGRDAKDAS